MPKCVIDNPERARTPRKQVGLTLIEIVLVVVVMGILFGMAYPSLEGMSPKYSLRSAARKLGSQIGWARSIAITAGQTYYFHYDLREGEFWIIEPPGEEDDPDLPIDERTTLNSVELPPEVRFDRVILPNGDIIEEEEVDIEFDPLGFAGSHIVYLRNSDDHLIAIQFNSLLGIVDFYNEEIDFKEF